ncbi:NAD dehydrogenase [Xylariales sp. PMI_506]|nr:NAD dehydrogenase [Xylariales sp. PMI_506]
MDRIRIGRTAIARFGLFTSYGHKSLRVDQTSRLFSVSSRREADFTHVASLKLSQLRYPNLSNPIVIGGGVVGLAVASELATIQGTSTLLIERHSMVGSETSSRNSEVVHAGLYYGTDSLKSRLCIEGKQRLYEICEKRGIPYRKTSKWIVAQDTTEMEVLEGIGKVASSLEVPTAFLSKKEIQDREPEIQALAGVLESPTTGIVDSHSLMAYLEGEYLESGGEQVLNTEVTMVEAIRGGDGGFYVHTTSGDDQSQSTVIGAEVVVNSAGLEAVKVSNMILPPDRQRQAYFAKGSYFSYASSFPKPGVLIYPAPAPSSGGLGTHLTLDLAGRIRFGPDIEWVEDPTDLSVSKARLDEAIVAIQRYLPHVDPTALDLDYCGIRPKLAKPQSGDTGKGNITDFYIKKEEGFEGFINLLGIESPGLTASLAIGNMVRRMVHG